MKFISLSLSIFFLSICLSAQAFVRLPGILSNHMVLQQNSKVQIWGWSGPGEKIKVKTSWSDQIDSTKGMNTAKWSVNIQTPVAGGPYTITIEGSNKIVLEDVLIGEVWVCSGQSNMEMNADWGDSLILKDSPNANYPTIRFFKVEKTSSDDPQDDYPGSWVLCTPETMKHFSAVGYYFGSRIHNQLNFPMGLISSNWGGTPAEVWTPAEEIIHHDELVQANSRLNPSDGWPKKPGIVYNSMIHPFLNFKIAGAIWYQGESNTGEDKTYTQLLSTLIQSWRKAWKIDFPFYYVQIAPFQGYGQNLNGPLLRESQTRVEELIPNTGMIVISDLVDDIKDIHPKNKKDVGWRLADLALTKTYGQTNIPYQYPRFKSMEKKGNQIKISFLNPELGLLVKGKEIEGFSLAGEDGTYYPAKAKIIKGQISLTSKEVKSPQNVRFGFTNSSTPNLFSKEGLPVNLFRTDLKNNNP